MHDREEHMMIRTGDTIENPVTGERMLFRQTSHDTGGELVEVEVWVQPDGFVAAKHVHPYQTEVFRVVEGELVFARGGEKITARPGDVVTVDAGTPHKFRNAGETVARFVTEVRPALQFEQLIETMYGLAADGKTNRKGMPNPFRLAVIARKHFDDVRLPAPPAWMQRMGLAVGAPLGRAIGYGPTYVPAAPGQAGLAPA
jgi:mannose-6-phosphate isomerase-like protein (cupin superfamily)